MHADVPGLSAKAWEEMLDIFHGRCRYCGDGPPLERDHRTPMSRLGQNRIRNIVPACRQCNRTKGTGTEEEYLKKLRQLWGRRVRRKPRNMDRRLRQLEAKYAEGAAEDRLTTLLRSLSVPVGRWPSGQPTKAEVAVHRNNQVRVAGSSFHEGTILSQLSGRDLWVGYGALIPEPENPHDDRAVAVHVNGRQIGYLPSHRAHQVFDDLQDLLRRGKAVAARVRLFQTARGVGARVMLDVPLETRLP